ncbi:MAG: tyrosine-type recombinase/integrase [Candidatus Humimicrobiaceae bacterium]
MARKKLPEIIDRKDAEKLFKQINTRYIRGKRNMAIFKLMLNTGLRVSEVCSLKNKDIDLDKQVLKVVNGKGGRDRLIPFPADITSYLTDWISEKNKLGLDSKYLFCSFRIFNSKSGQAGKKLMPRYIQTALKQYGQRAGIDELHPHTLRHSYATAVYQINHNLEGLRMLLGHSNISTTQIYINLSMIDLKSTISNFTAF